MTLTDISDYFKNYAVRHKLLLHNTSDSSKASFFCMNTDTSIEQYIRNNSMNQIMILLVPDKSLAKSNDTYAWMRNCAFMVLSRISDKTNEGIIAGQDIAEQICNDFCTRIISDRKILLDSIEDTGFAMHPCGPIGDNHYGYMTMFRQVDLFDYDVDDSKWND